MKIGITGHQERDGIDWEWVRLKIERYLARKNRIIGFSSLAMGTDQLFAKAVLDHGGTLIAVIPIDDYETYFKGEDLAEYQRLFAASDPVELGSIKRDAQAFLDAGKWIVREVDRMIAVWDGEPAEGAGGTGDIVRYANSLNKPVYHINPISKIDVDL